MNNPEQRGSDEGNHRSIDALKLAAGFKEALARTYR
jgi:hypothetical protein